MNKKLMKGNDSIISGVCSGFAQYFEQDVVLIRIIFVVAALIGGSGILIYFICLVLIPEFETESMIQRKERVKAAKKSGKI